jgi:hypothetical protein
MYYFIHPEAYRMRPLDPLFVILGCSAILTLRGRAGEFTHQAVELPALSMLETERAA